MHVQCGTRIKLIFHPLLNPYIIAQLGLYNRTTRTTPVADAAATQADATRADATRADDAFFMTRTQAYHQLILTPLM